MTDAPTPPDPNEPSDSSPPPATPPGPGPVPPSDSTPRPPVYTPPPAAAGKKSSMPWILGGCGCLTLILIIVAIVSWSVYRASKKAAELKKELKSTLASMEESQALSSATPAVRSSVPKSGWNSYTNVKENLPADLQPNFVAFSFDYPKTFTLQPQGKVNFVKVEKYAAAGKGNTAENFAVGYAWFTPPEAQSDALYDKLLDDLGKQLSGSFHNYREVKRVPQTVDGVASRAALFQADFNDAAKTMIYGKTIVVHPAGKKNGVTILLLGTSLSRDIRSADDLGVKGDTAEILRSFKFL
jgi:hypothetical protein